MCAYVCVTPSLFCAGLPASCQTAFGNRGCTDRNKTWPFLQSPAVGLIMLHIWEGTTGSLWRQGVQMEWSQWETMQKDAHFSLPPPVPQLLCYVCSTTLPSTVDCFYCRLLLLDWVRQGVLPCRKYPNSCQTISHDVIKPANQLWRKCKCSLGDLGHTELGTRIQKKHQKHKKGTLVHRL